MGYLSRFLYFQDRNSLTCFTLFISRGGGRSLPGIGPGGGKAANRGRTLGVALEKEDRAIYWKGGVKNLKKMWIRAGKVCGTELWNTGPGTSAGTVDFLWCCTTMLFIKITLSEPKASLWFLWMVLIVERHLRKFQSRSRSRSRIPLALPHNISCLNTFSGIFPYTFTIIYTGVLTPNMSGSIITKQKTQIQTHKKIRHHR